MGAEGREPSGEDRSWKLGDRDALTRRGARSSEMGAEGREPSGEDRRWEIGTR